MMLTFFHSMRPKALKWKTLTLFLVLLIIIIITIIIIIIIVSVQKCWSFWSIFWWDRSRIICLQVPCHFAGSHPLLLKLSRSQCHDYIISPTTLRFFTTSWSIVFVGYLCSYRSYILIPKACSDGDTARDYLRSYSLLISLSVCLSVRLIPNLF